ncbi:hypothetical protein BV20DRAFT_348772 [Pilatotrama ljubarskyi]|nr:hypothetical protein BV20DRAFT_348772 [Pilatotrama ljubarskyi]
MMTPLQPSQSATADPQLPDVPCRVNDFGLVGIPDHYQMNEFWDACQTWLADRGIHLYERRLEDPRQQSMPRYWTSPPFSNTASLPYGSLIDGQEEREHRSRILYAGTRLAYAQDTTKRDLIIKLVDNGSVEHETYQLLLQDMSVFNDTAEFPCVLPALDILSTPYEYSFVVMPMWGSPVHLDDLETVEEVLRFIKCSLRYLHRHRIAHRDLCENNIVVNGYSPSVKGEEFADRLREYRRHNETFYALIDYDQSLILPPNVSLRDCRRPAAEAWIGANPFKPSDINLGQPHYNPFAYDVAALGLLFRYYFAEAVPALPGLAALFDRMTDHSPSRRLTAEEALVFLDELTMTKPLETLKMHLVMKPSAEAMILTDTYWNKLSPEEQLLWGKYRTPSRSLLARVLDWVTDYPIGWTIVCFVRRALQI